MKTVKLYAGMTGEYEVIRTNAPKELIEQQLTKNNVLEENNKTVINPYDLLEQNGYTVELVCSCIDDIDLNTITIDYEFDYYDYPCYMPF